jgi:hypothetical protein
LSSPFSRHLVSHPDFRCSSDNVRTEGNDRPFDDSALPCPEVIATVEQQGDRARPRAHPARPDEPLGARLASRLEPAERRIDDRLAELPRPPRL